MSTTGSKLASTPSSSLFNLSSLINGDQNSMFVVVLLNILLSLSGWMFVYNCEPVEDSLSYNISTVLICFLGLFVIVNLIMKYLVTNDHHLMTSILINLGWVTCMFYVSSDFFNDMRLLSKWSFRPLHPLALLYGLIGNFVLFFHYGSSIVRQFYFICNGTLISLFYLRQLPDNSIWSLLVGLVIWDIFTLLSPFGPLRQMIEMAPDHLESLMIGTDGEGNDESEEESPQLGLGDLVFYSVLVCKSASQGDWLATSATVLGVLGGLRITELVHQIDIFNFVPALPIPILLGMSLHFVVFYLNELLTYI